ncbi:MAG: glycosyltransferase family 2 protein [Armatimonadetes bacterium]|nr:glycosyltransferase family 2 protein [Armatimonadota bacterium]
MLSLVVPAFNEEQALPLLHERLTAVMAGLGEDYEIVVVDDGSRDGTRDVLARLAGADSHLRYLVLSRNFGHQLALTAGLDHARGDAVISLDADLQHPPELIPELVRRWREGHEIVYTQRTDTAGAGWFKRLSSRWFYALINRASAVHVPENAADFRLLDRRVVDDLRRFPERARFLRGMIAWLGYRQAVVPFEAPVRAAGEAKYNVRKMLLFAIDAITSFSSLPLRLASAMGFFFSLVGVVYVMVVVYWYFYAQVVPGWSTTVCLILIVGGLQLTCLGVMGEYLARIYEEVKGRPLYLVREMAGFGAEDRGDE